MPRDVKLTPFFRADSGFDRQAGPVGYVAGFEGADRAQTTLAVTLEPDDVEPEVLSGMSFSITMRLDGTLSVEVDGRGDAVNEAIEASNPGTCVFLEEVIRRALDPKLIAMEDSPTTDLKKLRARVRIALDLVEKAIKRLDSG